MEMDQQRSTQRWERLRQAAESKEFLIEKTDDSWDHRVGHDAGDDLLMERREPLVRRWRRLKAVSMVVFSGRPAAYKMVRALQSPRHTDTAKLRSNNPVPEVVIMDVASNHPRSTETAQVQAWLSPRHAAKSPNNSVPEVVMDVTSNLPRPTETSQVAAVHVPTVDKMKKEQQGRCLKYSQKALGFAICTLIGYASAVSLSPSSNGGNDGNEGKRDNTTFKLAIAPFFVAICTDLFSLKTKAKQGNVLVYLSSFHLMLMIYFIFISFNMNYAYAIIFLPLVAGASLLQQKIWPEGHRQSTDEKVSKDLDNMFDLSALILNWSTFISAIMAIFRDLIPAAGQNQYISFSAVGLLFFLTIILGLYLMLITTVRTEALNLRAKYLDVLLICLLVSTLITALIMFINKK
ncbi:hypothetical protein PVAP13_6NG092500 [Panicum virgatum]|uniref:Uncharacterized protein n=1 Tax=Panicum virgatum TaxID=38727 RepID=A0A8T0QWA4_PANVG|nr:hypothetical protein PVAP13_6NG092500 [Panicum virgatum]